MTWKKFLTGLLVCLAAPSVVVLACYLTALGLNQRPSSGPLHTGTSSNLVLPWQELAFRYDFDGSNLKKVEPSPVDLVFLIDVSGSMSESIPQMAAAANQLTEALSLTAPGLVRYGVIRFDTEAHIDVPFTSNTSAIARGLEQLPAFTGGNDPEEMYAALEEMDTSARTGARKIGVFYSDGYLCTNEEMLEEETVAKAREFRDKGWELFAVTVPGIEFSALLTQITGTSTKIFQPGNERDLSRNFGFLGQAIIDSAGNQPRFATSFDGRHFDVPLESSPWQKESDDMIARHLPFLPYSQVVLGHGLAPKRAGLWSIGERPSRLDYLDGNNQPQSLHASRRPKVVVLTWFALFLLALPALLWCLYMWPQKVPIRELGEMVTLPPKRKPKPISLPPLPSHPKPRQDPVPTLFVGLGETGRQALDGVAWELEQADNGYHETPYRFLQLDLTQSGQSKDLNFDALGKRRPEMVAAPRDITQADQYLPDQQVPDHLRWFPSHAYRDRSSNDLDLSSPQTQNDRVLARLGFFRWLESDQFLQTLDSALEGLWNIPASHNSRQIVVLADWSDGFGSGCALDIARIFQRWNKARQNKQHLVSVPDIFLVLCDPNSQPDHVNRAALTTELQTASLAGSFPCKTVYRPSHPLLDQMDTQAPCSQVFSIETFTQNDAAAQCGQLAVTLTEPHSRTVLQERYQTFPTPGPVTFNAHGVHVVPGQLRAEISQDLLLRFLGPDVLLDTQPTADGRLRLRDYSQDQTKALLDAWIKDEPTGSLFQHTLQAARDLDASSLIGLIRKRTVGCSKQQLIEECELVGWELERQLIESVNQKLLGAAHVHQWRRVWFPGQAKAVLGELGQNLQRIAQDLEAGDAPLHTCFMPVVQVANASAEAFDEWVEAFSSHHRHLGLISSRADSRTQSLKTLKQRTYLDLGEQKQTEWGAESCLKAWLKTNDTLSPLHRHLNFTLRKLGDDPSIQARLHVGLMKHTVFDQPGDAIAHLDDVAHRLTAKIPSARLSGALALLGENKRLELAQGLMQRNADVRRSLICSPRGGGLPQDEVLVLRAFTSEIAQPVDHGNSVAMETSDQSSIRRIELAPGNQSGVANALVAQLPEVRARAISERLERKLEVEIGNLPPVLRLALADSKQFAAFAAAACAGMISKQADRQGRLYWRDSQGRCLTFGHQPSLAEAAIHYTEPWPAIPPDAKADPSFFQPLNDWLAEREGSRTHALTLAAIQLIQEGERGNHDI